LKVHDRLRSSSIWRVLRWLGLALTGLIVLIVTVFAVTGVPEVPGVTTSGVGRVPWRTAVRLGRLAAGMADVVRLEGWSPGREGIVVRRGIRGAIAVLPAPGVRPEPVPGLDVAASDIALRPGSTDDSFAYVLGAGGSEKRRLFWHDALTGRSTAVTRTPSRLHLAGFDPAGERLIFSSTARDSAAYDLYLWAPGQSEPDLLHQGGGVLRPLVWSPNGSSVIVGETLSHQAMVLHLLEVESGRLERLLPQWGDSVRMENPQYSKDGRFLYLGSDYLRETRGIWRLELATGLVEALQHDMPWEVVDFEVAASGRQIVLAANRDGRNDLLLLDLDDRAVRPVSGTPGYVSGLSMHPTRELVAVEVMREAATPEVHVFDLEENRWTLWAGGTGVGAPLAAARRFRYATFDSVAGQPQTVPAMLYPARRSGRPAPVVIELHGGPALRAPLMLHPAWTMLRQHGMAVIQPNVRGSSGFGKSYAALDDGFRREDAVRDVGALLEWIRDQPELDSHRIAVTGSSYGGYLVLASLIRYPDRLACGVNFFGISDPVAFLEQSGDFSQDVQRAEWGDERSPDVRTFLDSIAPIRRTNRIRSPLMVFQGANDIRVKVEQSRAMVESIRSAGGQVSYVEAANEGHGISSPLTNVYVFTIMIDFLDRCLGSSR
jgi:acetyl esterase/lipase